MIRVIFQVNMFPVDFSLVFPTCRFFYINRTYIAFIVHLYECMQFTCCGFWFLYCFNTSVYLFRQNKTRKEWHIGLCSEHLKFQEESFELEARKQSTHHEDTGTRINKISNFCYCLNKVNSHEGRCIFLGSEATKILVTFLKVCNLCVSQTLETLICCLWRSCAMDKQVL